MPGSEPTESELRQSREATVLAHVEAERLRDVEGTLATFGATGGRLELPRGEVADGRAAVADTYRELFTGFPT